jgi:hypothetical protein
MSPERSTAQQAAELPFSDSLAEQGNAALMEPQSIQSSHGSASKRIVAHRAFRTACKHPDFYSLEFPGVSIEVLRYVFAGTERGGERAVRRIRSHSNEGRDW